MQTVYLHRLLRLKKLFLSLLQNLPMFLKTMIIEIFPIFSYYSTSNYNYTPTECETVSLFKMID